MNVIQILGLALGTAWTSGINLYATVAVLGLLQRYEFVKGLPGGLDALDNWWVIGFALFLYAVEFVADKVPYVDTVWDAVHTFIRVPAGALLALAATTDLDPALQVVALLAGGGLALSTHGTKASLRATANLSPEPFTNWALSLAEDVFRRGGRRPRRSQPGRHPRRHLHLPAAARLDSAEGHPRAPAHARRGARFLYGPPHTRLKTAAAQARTLRDVQTLFDGNKVLEA